MAEPWLIYFFACNREMQPLSFFFLLAIRWGGGISGRVRALNLTVPLGSGRVGSDNLGYGPGSGFSFEPVQTSNPQIPDFFLWSRVTNNFFENIYHVMKEHLSTVSRIASYNQSFTKINTNDLFLSFLRLWLFWRSLSYRLRHFSRFSQARSQ